MLHRESNKAFFGRRDHAFVTRNLVGGLRRHIGMDGRSGRACRPVEWMSKRSRVGWRLCARQGKPRNERGPVTLAEPGSILFGNPNAVFFDSVDHCRTRHAQQFSGFRLIAAAHFKGLDNQAFVEFIETHACPGDVNL